MRFFAALRMTGRGMRPAGDAGGESHHRLRAVPLPLTREAKTGGRGVTAGGAEPRPYGVYMSTEIIWKAIRVGTLRKHAGGMFLVPTTAAMPRGGNREGRG